MCGALTFLYKPFDAAELLRVIERALIRSRPDPGGL
jgi:FixJ family two-component response regulator